MTEEKAKYEVKTQRGTLPAGTLKRRTDPDYQEPTFQDVRTLKAISGLTGRELCALAGVEDPRTWRRWSTDPQESKGRQIPYSTWRLLLLELGMVKQVKMPKDYVGALPLSANTRDALKSNGIFYARQLETMEPDDLADLPGIGEAILEELLDYIKKGEE